MNFFIVKVKFATFISTTMDYLQSIVIPDHAEDATIWMMTYLNVMSDTLDLSINSDHQYFCQEIAALAKKMRNHKPYMGGKITGHCKVLVNCINAMLKSSALTEIEKIILNISLSGTELDLGYPLVLSENQINKMIVDILISC